MTKQKDITKALLADALALMSKAGFPIKEEITLTVDRSLPIMGYTTQKDGHAHIVVSGWSLTSGGVEGLIIHELSHVYRIQTGHPSHNTRLHTKVLKEVIGHQMVTAVQVDVVQNTINNLQDLYADDISFAVYFDKKKENLAEFFQGWIREPINNPRKATDRWSNAGALLNAAFASANLKRHNVEDHGGKLADAIQQFLRKCERVVAQEFDYFEQLMTDLPDPITDSQFEKLLKMYLQKFLSISES